MSESNLISKEISQRKQKVLDHSDYRYLRIVQQNNGGGVTLDANGGQESVFQIPASQVFNFSRSDFRYSEVQDAGAAAGTDYYYKFCDLVPHIQRLTVMTQKGQVLICDIADCHKYTNAILRHETRLDEMLTNDRPDDNTGIFEGLVPPDGYQIAMPTFAAATDGDPTNAEINAWAGTIAVSSSVKTATNSDITNKFIEPRYYIRGPANATLTIHNRISLSLFKNTILAMDKNRYFGDIVEIRITWNKITNVYFQAKATPVATAVNATQPLHLSNLELNLCVENNPVIVQDMKTKFANGGFVDYIPYLYSSKQNKSGALQHIEMDINRSQGSHIRKIIWFPSNVFEEGGMAYFHGLDPQKTDRAGTIVGNSFITDFNPLINGNPIYSSSVKQRAGTAIINEPYNYQRRRLKGSCISSVNDFNYNFTWYQDWTDPSPVWMKPLDKFDPDVYIDGYPLTEPVKYELDINFGAAGSSRNHYLYAVIPEDLNVLNGRFDRH